MNRRPRHVEFSWPVAGADLDALVVLEAVPDPEGHTQWVPREPRVSTDTPASVRGPAWDDSLAGPPSRALPASPLPSSIRISLAVTLADGGPPSSSARSMTKRHRASERRPSLPVRVAAPIPRHQIALTTTLERFSLITMGVVIGAALVIVAVPDARRATLATNPAHRAVATDATAAPPIAPAGVMTPAALRGTAPSATRVSLVTRPPEQPTPAVAPQAPGHTAAARAVPSPAAPAPGQAAGAEPSRSRTHAAIVAPRSTRESVATSARRASAPAVTTVDMVTPGVLDAIRRYAAAYSRLDAAATQAVWRGADRMQLVQAFSRLREQRLTLRNCVVQPVGDEARATCRGTLRYRPRVGEHSTRTRAGDWQFVAGRWADGWVIHSITAP